MNGSSRRSTGPVRIHNSSLFLPLLVPPPVQLSFRRLHDMYGIPSFLSTRCAIMRLSHSGIVTSDAFHRVAGVIFEYVVGNLHVPIKELLGPAEHSTFGARE